MTRSVDSWRAVIARKATQPDFFLKDLADFVLGDLIGYRNTSRHLNEDKESLVNFFTALRMPSGNDVDKWLALLEGAADGIGRLTDAEVVAELEEEEPPNPPADHQVFHYVDGDWQPMTSPPDKAMYWAICVHSYTEDRNGRGPRQPRHAVRFTQWKRQTHHDAAKELFDMPFTYGMTAYCMTSRLEAARKLLRKLPR